MGCTVTTSNFRKYKLKAESAKGHYLTKEEIRIIKTTWETLKPELDVVGLTIFKRLYSQNKHIEQLFTEHQFTFGDDNEREHGRIIMEAFGSAVECLQDINRLSTLLKGVGERHGMYGVQPEMLWLMWSPLITTFEEQLGLTFTPLTREAWEKLFIYICKRIIHGMQSWARVQSMESRDCLIFNENARSVGNLHQCDFRPRCYTTSSCSCLH